MLPNEKRIIFNRFLVLYSAMSLNAVETNANEKIGSEGQAYPYISSEYRPLFRHDFISHSAWFCTIANVRPCTLLGNVTRNICDITMKDGRVFEGVYTGNFSYQEIFDSPEDELKALRRAIRDGSGNGNEKLLSDALEASEAARIKAIDLLNQLIDLDDRGASGDAVVTDRGHYTQEMQWIVKDIRGLLVRADVREPNTVRSDRARAPGASKRMWDERSRNRKL